MKKLFLSISVTFLLLFGVMGVSASAARYNQLPVTMYQSVGYSESMFTMTDFEVYISSNETPVYTNYASIDIYGNFNKGNSMTFSISCYDVSGNHIKTLTETMYASDMSEDGDGLYYWFGLDVPDVTAFIEVGTLYPASWTNTYFYAPYMNVYSDDGRVLGIPELLLPVYEKSGWHGPVWMYALDGRTIEVPYYNVKAYQNVGWYLWEDYMYIEFKNNYAYHSSKGDYSNAFNEVEWAISVLEGTYYENSLYEYKTKLMDAWRKSNNGPLAFCSSYVGSDGKVNITLRNVSYKDIKAFKTSYECYDIFDKYLGNYEEVSYTGGSGWLYSGECGYYSGSVYYNTDHIKNFRVTQVVYSDGTSWYR